MVGHTAVNRARKLTCRFEPCSWSDMPEVNIDDRNFELYKQCEIRRPSEKGYYFDIIWIKADLSRKGNTIQDEKRNEWVVHEVFGAKKMPGGRGNFKQMVP